MATHHDPQRQEGIAEVLGELDELAATHTVVCIADVLDDFGRRSFGPFIMLPALVEISPVGAIPGVPSLLAFVIAITAAQIALCREHIWMPQFIQRRAVSGKGLHRALRKLRGIAHWLDEHSHGRLETLTEGLWLRVAGVIVIALCCTVPPLEFFPLASSAPMLAIAAFGLAMTVRDGVMMLVAMTLAIGAMTVVGYLFATLSTAIATA